MVNFIAQLSAMGIVLGTFFIGPAIALSFWTVQSRRRTAERRSPINRELLRGPGYSLREQLEEAATDVVWQLMLIAMLPLLVLALYLAQRQLVTLTADVLFIYVASMAACLAFTIRKLLKLRKHVDDLRAGYDAELAVGQELDQLMRRGARVFHDFPADGFNIDHVVISAAGLFAVETKGYTKPARIKGRPGATVYFDGSTLKFPTWASAAPIEQAERQAKWLAKWTSDAVGENVSAAAVVALPGWWVERTRPSPVKVINGKEVAALLESNDTTRCSAQLVQRIAHQVEQRCRTVVPTYRRHEAKHSPASQTRAA